MWILQFFPLIFVAHSVHSFCYEKVNTSLCGPSSQKWSPTCHSGQAQSPIDIKVPSSEWAWEAPVKPQPIISFNAEYKQGSDTAFLTNNGHSVQLSITKDLTSRMVVQTNLFAGRYVFGQLHCHWGSEHTLDTKRYPLECHCVHYDEQYGNISAAVASGNYGALLILGILYQNQSAQGEAMPPNSALDPLTANLNKVQTTKSGTVQIGHVNIHDFYLQYIEPQDGDVEADNEQVEDGDENELRSYNAYKQSQENLMDVYNYNGSLTTPGCNEKMHWLVLRNVQPISNEQLEQFYATKNDENEKMTGNYRDLQPLNQRLVTPIRLHME